MASAPQKTTKSFVEVSEIRDSVLILKSGSMRMIIEVGSTNFALKSNDEQIAITSGFQNLINSVDFTLQIVVHSRKLNIDKYLQSLDELGPKLPSELLKIQAIEYSRFIKGLTELADIMSKKFYVVVPFYVIESTTGVGKRTFFDGIKSIFKPAEFVKNLSDQEFVGYKTQLEQRVELIMGNIVSMGLTVQLLHGDELKELFYGVYNPSGKERQSV